MRRSLHTACLAALAWLAVQPAAALDDNAVLRITLEDAVRFQTPRPQRQYDWADVQDIQIDLTRRDGAWDPAVWGFMPLLPGQEHLGRLTKAQATDTGWHFEIDLTINNQRDRPLLIGGQLALTVHLTRHADGYAATYSAESTGTNTPATHRRLEDAWGWGYEPGTRDWQQSLISRQLNTFLEDAKTQGEAAVQSLPLRFATPFNAYHFKPNEHPRLLFRGQDLDTLRQRMATPEGKAIVAQLEALLDRAHTHGFGYHYPQATHSMGPNWAVGHGLLYQLTGEQKHADIARNWCTGQLFGPYYYGGGWLHAYTLQGMAVAYDLCYDGWDDDFRSMVYAFLEQNVRDLAQRGDGLDLLNTDRYYTFANDQDGFVLPSIDHDDRIRFRAGAATAALMLMGDTPPAFKPTPLDQVRVLEPADDYEPWFGVPVVPFEDAVMPRAWLTNGPFRHGSTDALIAQFHGGWDKLRPEPGDIIAVDGVDLDWRPYHPANKTGNRPTIYMRDCAKHWTSSTGKGFPPGKALVKQWSQDAGKRVGYQFVLYTVIDNDTDRVVQAMPNWKSHSAGCRMWINGQPVRDGDLVRLKRGRYTLAVDVKPTGGYANQTPCLRQYTQADYQRDAAAFGQAAQAYGGDDVFTNQMMRNYAILMRSVMRYVDAEVGADGWGPTHAHETLLPLLTMHRIVAGDNLAHGTGLQHLTEVAARMRGHAPARPYDYMVSQSALLMDAQTLPVARRYLDAHSLGIGRPLDALVALATHPMGLEPAAPDTRYALARDFASHGVVAANTGFAGGSDFMTRLHTAAGPHASPFAFGMLELHGYDNEWTDPAPHTPQDVHAGNNPAIRGAFPAGPGKVVYADYREDGSSSVTVRLDRFTDGRFTDRGEFVRGAKDPKVALQRAMLVDYGLAQDGSVVVITADQWEKVGKLEKSWHMRLGRTEVIDDPTDKRSPGVRFFKPGTGTGFDLTLGRDRDRNPRSATMRVQLFADHDLHVTHQRYGDNGKSFRVGVEIDRVLSRKERLEKDRIEQMSGNARQRDDDTGVLGTGDGALDELLGDFQQDVAAEKHQEDRLGGPVVLLTVITIDRDGRPHPPAKITHHDAGATLAVGGKTYTYNSTKLWAAP